MRYAASLTLALLWAPALAAEIYKDTMTFNAISRSGQIVDSGLIQRRKVPEP